MSGGDPVLVSQCLNFCQALASMGQTISFSLTLGSTFSFNLETRKKHTSPGENVISKKKPSPSTMRRNHRRKEEFLSKKREATRYMDSTSVLEDTFQCEHCANSFKTENGLKIHMGKSHKALKPSLSPEKVRDHLQDTSLTLSPVRDNIREEIGTEEEEDALTVPEKTNAHEKESQTDIFLRVDEKNYPTGPSLDWIYDEPPASVYHPTWVWESMNPQKLTQIGEPRSQERPTLIGLKMVCWLKFKERNEEKIRLDFGRPCRNST